LLSYDGDEEGSSWLYDFPPLTQSVRIQHFTLRVLQMGVLYFLSAWLGLSLFVVQPAAIATVWPASGVLLAALLMAPRRDWPALLLGAGLANLCANLFAGNPPLASLGLMLVNLAEALFATMLLARRLVLPPNMERLRDIVYLVGFAAIVSNAITALLGAAVVVLSFGGSFGQAWWIWFLADGIGMLMITPLALSWLHPAQVAGVRVSIWRIAEAALLFAALAVLGTIILNDTLTTLQLPLFMLFPLLVWVALRFQMRGATLAGMLLAGLATWGTSLGRGPFVERAETQLDAILSAQLYMVLVVPCAYVIAALIAERTAAQTALLRENSSLEEQVHRRTADLVALNQQLHTEIAEHVQAEQSARASELRYRQIIETAAEGVWIVDTNWNTTFVNGIWRRCWATHPTQCLVGGFSILWMPKLAARLWPISSDASTASRSCTIFAFGGAMVHRFGRLSRPHRLATPMARSVVRWQRSPILRSAGWLNWSCIG
jgi:integral membrane sensor domain MASE1